MMKKIAIAILLMLIFLVAGGYFLYRSLMPELIAEAVISESLPNYIPKRLRTRVEAIRKPLNKGTKAMLEKMHASEIPLEELLRAIDNINEEEAYAFLDDLNKARPENTDEVFDLAKKHFSTDFDPEIFREPFHKHVNIKQVNKAIDYANLNRRSNDVDISTAKAILKQIIIEKDKELRVGKPVSSNP